MPSAGEIFLSKPRLHRLPQDSNWPLSPIVFPNKNSNRLCKIRTDDLNPEFLKVLTKTRTNVSFSDAKPSHCYAALSAFAARRLPGGPLKGSGFLRRSAQSRTRYALAQEMKRPVEFSQPCANRKYVARFEWASSRKSAWRSNHRILHRMTARSTRCGSRHKSLLRSLHTALSQGCCTAYRRPCHCPHAQFDRSDSCGFFRG